MGDWEEQVHTRSVPDVSIGRDMDTLRIWASAVSRPPMSQLPMAYQIRNTPTHFPISTSIDLHHHHWILVQGGCIGGQCRGRRSIGITCIMQQCGWPAKDVSIPINVPSIRLRYDQEDR
ncbi:hypothetical protein Vafri_11843 [Volvox africanus]|uniref:Uncharacterized protein n=1 Tax=Volvox africanus TaxID=51714 RepID=A0A8J4F242_9CHLO|nr:hypothetical protein Vafri_11843 [Volvox africanus]